MQVVTNIRFTALWFSKIGNVDRILRKSQRFLKRYMKGFFKVILIKIMQRQTASLFPQKVLKT